MIAPGAVGKPAVQALIEGHAGNHGEQECRQRGDDGKQPDDAHVEA